MVTWSDWRSRQEKLGGKRRSQSTHSDGLKARSCKIKMVTQRQDAQKKIKITSKGHAHFHTREFCNVSRNIKYIDNFFS
jgi:hypothetical protein